MKSFPCAEDEVKLSNFSKVKKKFTNFSSEFWHMKNMHNIQKNTTLHDRRYPNIIDQGKPVVSFIHIVLSSKPNYQSQKIPVGTRFGKAFYYNKFC